MKLFILFIIFNLSNLTFIQAQEIFGNLETHPIEIVEAEASIWLIQNKTGSRGTGFFISPNLFVTNFHILSTILENTKNLNEIYLSQKENSNTFHIEKIVSVSALYDLAIIETKETSQHYLNLSETELKTDEDLFIIGYPTRSFIIMKKTEKISYENDSLFYFSANNSISPGTSGSPVLNDQGQVVGILYIKVNRNSGLATKRNHLKNLISGNIGQNCEAIGSKNCLEKEIENLKKLAEQNYTSAQFQLAIVYYYGIRINQNYEEAFYWFQQAAEQGHTGAQYYLAVMYLKIIKNYKLAVYWFQQAAEQNFKGAQHMTYISYTIRIIERIRSEIGWD